MEPKHPQDSNIEPVTAPVDTTPFVTDTATPVTSHSPLGAETPATPSQPPLWRRILIRTLQVIFLAYIALVLFRIPHVIEKEKTDAVVAQIHATKLTMDDVMGTNLPPDPGALADATIAGVDANTNGIRDDVELAIFRDYATSSKTRAVLLQYALALQMEFTQPIVNTETVIAVAQETGRAHMCVGEILSRENLTEFFECFL